MKTDDGTGSRAAFDERRRHLEALVELNRKAGVDPEVIDLIEAYARLKLRTGQAHTFYEPDAPLVASSRPVVAELLGKNPHLDAGSRQFLAAYAAEMSDRYLPIITSRDHLAHHLGVTAAELAALCRSPRRYRRFALPKRDGGTRELAAPVPALKSAQRWIARRILVHVGLSPRAHGFRRRRSIATNARYHLGRAIVVKIDLERFFPSIGRERVAGVFATLGFPRGVAEALADLATCDGVLPIGGPSSPGLANIVARHLDYRLHALGHKEGFSHTRYADDLTFSSNRRELNSMIPFFREIIGDEGFRVNEKKVRVMRGGDRQRVTGVIVNERAGVGREEARRLRAVLHNCRTGNLDAQRRAWAEHLGVDPAGYELERFARSLQGKIGFVTMLDRALGRRLAADFARIPFPWTAAGAAGGGGDRDGGDGAGGDGAGGGGGS